jgi:hypothetical protein
LTFREGWDRLRRGPWSPLRTALGCVLAIFVVSTVYIPTEGPRVCRDAMADDPNVYLGGMRTSTVTWTRVYDDHWIVVMRATPTALGASGGSLVGVPFRIYQLCVFAH